MGKVYYFGSGNLFFIDRAAVTPTPVKAGTLQEGSVEFSFSKKEVLGQNQFPDEIFRADGKITGKSKMAQIKMNLFQSFFSGIPATGQIIPVFGEAGAIPANPGPYTITPAHGADLNKDLGVIFAATGAPLTRVAAAPAAGQYSLNEDTGVYTFAAADQGLPVKFDYLYNSALVGKTLTIANQLAGVAPAFLLVLANVTGVNGAVLILNKCVSEKLSFNTKRGDVAIPEFDFSAAADDADNIGTLSLPE